MGTHPIFDSDFDCLTELFDDRNRFDCSRAGSDFFSSSLL